jgi:predicted ester cyclase
MNKPKCILLTLVLFLFAGSGSFLQAQCTEKHKALLEKMDLSMEKKDPEFLRELYHADAKRHTPEGVVEGIDNLIAEAKKFYADMPDVQGENLDVICMGDKIATRWTGTAAMAGTDKTITANGMTIMHLKGDKVIEEWEQMDGISLMMQMGYTITPPEGGGGN